MATPAGKEAARDALRNAMHERNLGITELAEMSEVDPATAGDFLAGRRWPRAATLSKLEKAVGLTPGMLAALGEESVSPAAPLDQASTRRLVALLTQRFIDMEETLSEWAVPAARYERRHDRTYGFALKFESSDGVLGDAARVVTSADIIEATRPLTDEEEARLDEAVLLLDAHRWQAEAKGRQAKKTPLGDALAGLRGDQDEPPAGEGATIHPLNPKHQRMLEDAQEAETAADDGDDTDGPGE